MSSEFTFTDEAASGADIELFLHASKFPSDPVARFKPSDSMAHVLHRCGAFPSVSQARKNGWSKPIPAGYSEHMGPKKIKIFIWNSAGFERIAS